MSYEAFMDIINEADSSQLIMAGLIVVLIFLFIIVAIGSATKKKTTNKKTNKNTKSTSNGKSTKKKTKKKVSVKYKDEIKPAWLDKEIEIEEDLEKIKAMEEMFNGV